MTHDYDDIIGLPHYEPKHHPRMPLYDRVAQFAPFAALTGHSAAIEETARVAKERVEGRDRRVLVTEDGFEVPLEIARAVGAAREDAEEVDWQ